MQTRHPLETDATKQDDAVLPLGAVNVISLGCIDAPFIGCRFIGSCGGSNLEGIVCYLRADAERKNSGAAGTGLRTNRKAQTGVACTKLLCRQFSLMSLL
jgi:hypothetical protein